MKKAPSTTNRRREAAPGQKGFDFSLWEESLDREYAEREKVRLATLARVKNLLTDYFRKRKPRAVFLVGSILEEGQFYPFSDVDVLVKGLRQDYLKTTTELEGLLNRPIDLIEGERCRFLKSLEQKGRRIL
jgi:predicted nucleotidyltransferase